MNRREAPLAAAEITLLGSGRSVLTDSAGRFVLGDLAPGRHVSPFGTHVQFARCNLPGDVASVWIDGWKQRYCEATGPTAIGELIDRVLPSQIEMIEVYRGGTYLGEVRAPPRTELAVFARDRVWGIRRGDEEEMYVVRFRLAPTVSPAVQ